jgi:hypothetical protein
MATDYIDAMASFVSPEALVKTLPPICDFVARYDRSAQPYPVQSTLLKILFLDIEHMTQFDNFVIRRMMEETENGGEVTIPLDIYERMSWLKAHGYKHFTTFVYCGGRRGGKGFLGGKIGAYQCANLVALGSPQRHFGVVEGHDIYLDVLATQFSQAQGMLFNDIRDAIISNDWLSQYVYYVSRNVVRIQTPYDRMREEQLRHEAEMMGRKNRTNVSVASIVVEPSAASSSSIRGRASFMQCFDEFAHGLQTTSDMSSDRVYDAATPSTMQFGKDALIYIPSSPWSEVGKFYSLYQQCFEAGPDGKAENPQMLAVRLPSWWPYLWWEYDQSKTKAIIETPDRSPEVHARETIDPEAFNVEFRANFAKTENAYMNPKVIRSLFEPFPDEMTDRNVTRESGLLTFDYRAHADAGRSQDNFCFAMGHREFIEGEGGGQWHAFIDVMKTWQPPDFPEDEQGVRRVDYTQVVEWLENAFKHFRCYKYTMDQWNSAYVIDKMRRDSAEGAFANSLMSVSVDNHTAAENFKRWEAYKTACYQGWVHIPHQIEFVHKAQKEVCLPEQEMQFMIVKDGKTVTWPTSGTVWTHGDMVDAISTVVVDLLGDQLLALSEGNLASIVGTAQGGYNEMRSSIGGAAASDPVAYGDEYMRMLGYL